MNKIIQFVLILAVGLILYFLLNRMMQKLMVELSEILYKEVNPEKYLQVLNSWKGKMFFSRKTRSLMAIDALLMQNETANLRTAGCGVDESRKQAGPGAEGSFLLY